MFASLLTTLFFSLSVIFGARSARVLGPRVANLGRITIATCFLAIWANGFGAGVSGPGFWWFFLSGVVGFGLGDMALFGALPRIGPRLAILITQCLAAPIAALAEWLWLGTTLHTTDLICAAIILVGVAIALAPDHGEPVPRAVFWVGTLFGIGSACGQAFGAVLSRHAVALGEAVHVSIDGGSAAYQRAIGGLLMTWVAALIFRGPSPPTDPHPNFRRGSLLVFANALAGPTIGVGCYQWALTTTPSGIVLPIVATSPLVTMLLGWWIDDVRPTRRATFGGLIAVAGAVALKLAQA